MKRFLFILLLVPSLTFSQHESIQLVQDQSSYYYVTVDGDTVSQHSTERKAFQSAHNWDIWVPTADVRIVWDGLIRVGHSGEVPPIRDIFWTTARQAGQPEWELGLSFNTEADSAWVETVCVSTDSLPSYRNYNVPKADSSWSVQKTHRCNDFMKFTVKAVRSGQTYQSSPEVVPLD